MAEEKTIMGYIDHLEGGYLTGWVACIGDPAPIDVAAYSDTGEFLGCTDASVFREDLKLNGINEGCHGFRLMLNNDLLASSKSIILKDKKTDKLLNIDRVQIKHTEEQLHIQIASLVNNRLEFRACSPLSGCKKSVVFKIGNETLAVVPVDTGETQTFDGHIWIPAKFLDGKKHLVECHVPGEPCMCGAGIVHGDPILTPLEFLTHSYKAPGLISKPMTADNRYESLTLQLDNARKTKRDISDIGLIHTILVEGFQNRKSFPKFSLPSVKTPEVTIIVPAYNKFAMTYHCIASIALAYNERSYEVILADDCSEDETTEAENIIGNLIVSRNKQNLRFLRSCNEATKKAKGKYIIFLNNDTEVSSYWIDALIKQHETNPEVGLTGSKLLNADGTLQEAGGIIWGNGEPWNGGRNQSPYAPEWNYTREVDYVTGAAMCIRKDIWESVGKFSEEYAPCYYEDADLAMKVADAGYKVLYVPHSEVVHLEGQSHGTDVTKGLKKYQTINEGTFRRKWFGKFKNYPKPALDKLLIEKDRKVEQRILVIDYATPMLGVDAGSYAAVQEIKLMIALGFKVTFVPENLAYMGKYTLALQEMGTEVLIAPFYYSLQHILDTRLDEMDAVYITRYDVARKYIETIKKKHKPIIFNNADLHFLREIRAAAAAKNPTLMETANITRGQELEVCRKVDAILTYNTTEHAVIASHNMEVDKLHITPWVLELKEPGQDFKAREGIAFLGGYNHKPNVEAVEFMVKHVMPALYLIRPDIKFYVYGSKMPEEFMSFETDNVIIKGFVETLDEVYQDHRIFVAPLISGAGIKGKVLDAMSYGTPTILTDVAAEGTGLINGLNTLAVNDADEWVQAIVRLYDDAKLWQRFRENSLILAKENFSFEKGVKQFKKIFESVGIYSTR